MNFIFSQLVAAKISVRPRKNTAKRTKSEECCGRGCGPLHRSFSEARKNSAMLLQK